ncbi:MAG: hypothetical protein [Caudoviricetes sp.]|nr:MAG: hypothetical protein [Caudoviricetes sp.]
MDENTATLEKIDITLPKKYKVIIKDESDGSPMNGKTHFVQQLMTVVFGLQSQIALQVIKNVTNDKKALIGIYPKQIAETYVKQCKEYLDRPENKRFCFNVKMEVE